MVNLDATTPQLKVVKQWTDALNARDLNVLEPILSKDFTLKSFPEATGFPNLTKEEYIQQYGAVLSLFSTVDVRTRHPQTGSKHLADICKLSGRLPRSD
jgi:hypothetical protein